MKSDIELFASIDRLCYEMRQRYEFYGWSDLMVIEEALRRMGNAL